jgi:hypothetical protein
LRNHFAHCTKLPTENKKNKKFEFCLTKFKPINSNGEIKENPYNVVIKAFSNIDFDNLVTDMKEITSQLTKIYGIVSEIEEDEMTN